MNKPTLLLKKDSNYFRTRHYLFSKNFVLAEVMKKTKPDLEKNIGKNKINKFIDSPDSPEFAKPFSLIMKISSYFEIDPHFLVSLIFLDKGFLSYSNNLEVITNLNTPLHRRGIYIRFHPRMNLSDWAHEYKKAKQRARLMPELYPDISKDDLAKERVRNQAGFLDSKRNLDLYIKVESQIPKYLKRKDTLKDSDSGASIIDGIFEGLIVKTGIQDDKELNKIKSSYQNTYYGVAERYRLPTFKDLSKYLQLLINLIDKTS